MKRKRALLLLVAYGFSATLAVFLGLVERRSLMVTFVSFHLLVCLLVPLLHGLWEEKLSVQWKRAWIPFDREGMSYGLAIGAMLMTGVMTGAWLLIDGGVIDASHVRHTLMKWGVTPGWLLPFSLYLVIVNSLLEELLWRGFVLERLLHALARPAAVLVSGFFYCLYHLIVGVILFGLLWGVLITALVFGTGLMWGWMKGLFPSIYTTWLSHLMADLGIVLVLHLWVY
ncbi:CPBP family intramembrane glutamic endopeptidase [Brevibacillus borstelensis]|uniref:CPBP family intramembrane glutamic endopeptidase n=1 Tax=Brevibacillus borstelensis TaxID=45462 RepID=UPI0030C006C7